MSTQYTLSLKFKDILHEEDMVGKLQNERTGCFVQYNNQFVDVLTLKEGAQLSKKEQITFNLQNDLNEAEPKLVFIVKDIQNDEPYVGSVSIQRSILLESEPGQVYNMWITLFDDQADDEYDGAMGLNDDEEPRILVEMVVKEINKPLQIEIEKEETNPIASQLEQPVPKGPDSGKNSKSYMNPIKNFKDTKKIGASTVNVKSQPKLQTAVKQSPQKKSNPSLHSQKDQASAQKSQQKLQSKPSQPLSLLKKQIEIQEIQKILEQNPSKKQNVQFLKQLLDSQLGKLCQNLKTMQSENSEIETDIIQRLQIIEKFGNDASNGLDFANDQNLKIIEALTEQKSQHQEIMNEQKEEQQALQAKLIQLENHFKQLRSIISEKQQSHQSAMLQKQEIKQWEMNQSLVENQISKKNLQKISPRRSDDIEAQRQTFDQIKTQINEGSNQLRDMNRQIPTLAADFQFEVEQLCSNIEVVVEQNSELKGDIICLEEEKESQKLIAKLEEEKAKMLEFELKQLQERERQLEDELNEYIDKGDNLYTLLRQESGLQDEQESKLSDQLNQLANKNNILLRSKLNCNKGDFERLINLKASQGQTEGAIGQELEKKVSENDNLILEIFHTKKEAYKGLIDIRDVMKCNIDQNQKENYADQRQVDHMCELLNEKDQLLYLTLMPQKDLLEQEYLANQVSTGLRQIMNGDKVDIQQHIFFNNSGMEKLNKMMEKHKVLKEKQKNNFDLQQKTLASMNEQIKILSAEKDLTLKEIKLKKEELEALLRKLQQRKKEVEQNDELIMQIESQIDQKYDLMEGLEQQIIMKNELIKDLENQINMILNKKVEPVRPKFQYYNPIKGDQVDEKLAEYINQNGSPVPWTRQSESTYTYGSKRVNVKYMRNNLIIKVGGGSMMVEEFVANYEDIELAKMNYSNPGSGIPLEPAYASMSKQMRVSLARGVSPRIPLGSPNAQKKSLIETIKN